MSDSLELTMLSEVEDTVDTRTHGYTSRVVVGRSEGTECLSFHVLHLAGFRIVFLFRLPEEPVHAVGDARRHVDIFEGSEVRKADLEIVGHTVLELVEESRLVELGCLEVDPVLEACIVTQRELLIELLLSYTVLSLERIKPVD